ncbi:MAG: hypothetical protein R6U19_02040 [Bacteroidales bacterium]
MNRLIQIISVSVLMLMVASCSQKSAEDIRGDWRVDSLKAVNISEYAEYLSKKGLEDHDSQVAQIQSILDTVTDEAKREQLEMSLDQMEDRKDEMAPENFEERIEEQNSQSQGNFIMSFAADSAFYILSTDKDTIQRGSWEFSGQYLITQIPRAEEADTMEIVSHDKENMVLNLSQQISEDFNLGVDYFLSKEPQ